MNFSLLNLFYFAFRVGPFLLISFFLVTSFFQQDIKCFVYMVGLLVACFLAIITGNGFSLFDLPDPTKSSSSHCHVVTLGDAGPLSKLPLSTVVYAYTAMYLAYPLHPAKTLSAFMGVGTSGESGPKSRSDNTDLPLFFLFPLLILVDAVWLVRYDCFNSYSVAVAALLGVMTGFAWSYIIGSSGKSPFHYFGILGGGQVCERPSGTTFRCESRNSSELTLAEIMALYGVDSVEYRQFIQDTQNKKYPEPPGARHLKWKSKDGTVFDLYEGDTIKCNSDSGFSWNRLEISGNDVNNPENDFWLHLYPTDEIAKSWDANYKAKAKAVGDCSSFHYGPDMTMNTGDILACTNDGVGCSASNMPKNGTEITCLNQMNTNMNPTSEDTTKKNTMQFMTYRVVDGKLCLLPNDQIRESWKNASNNPTPKQLQIQDCTGLPVGDELKQYTGPTTQVSNPVKIPNNNTKVIITTYETGTKNSDTHILPQGATIPEHATVQCMNNGGGKGAANQAANVVSDNSPKDSKTTVPTYYKVNQDGSLSMYPKNDTNVPLSYNVDYLSTPVVIDDCSPYTFNGTLGFNPDRENPMTQSIQSFINNTATYLQIYNLTGMNDLSGSMTTLQKDLKLMLLGYLITGDWNEKDQNQVSNDVQDVVNDLTGISKKAHDVNFKPSGYSQALATSIREQTSNFGKDLPCKQWPQDQHPPVHQKLQVKQFHGRVLDKPLCLTTDNSNNLFTWPCDKTTDIPRGAKYYQHWTYDKLSFVLTNDDTQKSIGAVAPNYWGNKKQNGSVGMGSQGSYTWMDKNNVLYIDTTAGSTNGNYSIATSSNNDPNQKWGFYLPTKNKGANVSWVTRNDDGTIPSEKTVAATATGTKKANIMQKPTKNNKCTIS